MTPPIAVDLDELVRRCHFPDTEVPCVAAFSGGPDSTALVALAQHARLNVTAHHVDHGIRARSSADAARARSIADQLGVPFVLHTVEVAAGSNLEARARAARQSVLPPDAMTGHTADDQAETVLVRLLRGTGVTGLAAMTPGPRHPLLGLRRSETHAVCTALAIEPVHDETNDLPDAWRNRVRAEILPLLADIGSRDPVPIITRTAELAAADDAVLDELAAGIDPTDARSVTAAPVPLARRAVRRWLTVDGYPPDAASTERVLDVAAGRAVACEVTGGRRVERSRQRLRVVGPPAGNSDQ